MKRMAVGIDPGTKRAALVAFDDADESTPLAWATFACANQTGSHMARVLAMADQIINRLAAWVEQFQPHGLDIVIELSVAKKGRAFNPKTYALQNRLIQEIESGIYYRIAGEVVECWLTEVYPNTSKKMATNNGSASKDEVIAASPFKDDYNYMPKVALEAIADAWSHGLSAWPGKSGTVAARLNLSQMTMSEVKYAGYGSPA